MLRNRILQVLVLLTTFSIYLWSPLLSIWENNIVSGWDGNFHLNIYKKFHEEIFPNIYGWINSWNAGNPWPIGYPPLLSYIFGILFEIFPNDQADIFKFVTIFLIILSPLLIWRIFNELYTKDNLYAFTGTLLFILYLASDQNFAGTLGVTIRSTLENGLYPQFWATIMLFLWIYLWMKYINTGKRYLFFSTNLLASAVLLSNLHVGEILFLIIGGYFIYDIILHHKLFKEKNFAKIYEIFAPQIIYILLILLTSSFWIIPLLEQKEYFITRPLSQMSIDISISSIFIFIFLAVIGIFGLYYKKLGNHTYISERNFYPIAISGVLVLIICIAPLQNIFPSLPLQPFRLYPYFYIICIFLSVVGVDFISRYVNIKHSYLYVSTVLIVILSLWIKPIIAGQNINIFTLQQPDIELIEYLKTKDDGRISIEVWNDYLTPTHVLLSSEIPDESNANMLWGVFRESAVSSPYIAPVRNSFSISHESFGTPCWLCYEYKSQLYPAGPGEFYSQSVEMQLKRANYFNLKYIVVKSEQIAITLVQIAEKYNISLEKKINNWYIFRNNNASYAKILKNDPILTYTDLIAGDRDNYSYDWHRLNEEWLFQADDKIILLKNKSDKFDTSELGKFNQILYTHIEANELEQLKKALTLYADKTFYIFYDSNTITEAMQRDIMESNQKTVLIKKTFDVRKDFASLYDAIRKKAELFENTNVTDIKYTNQAINLGGNISNIYISENYNPWWSFSDSISNTPNNADIYMASPSFIYIKQVSSDRLEFSTRQLSVTIGTIISSLSLIIILANMLYKPIKRYKGKKINE